MGIPYFEANLNKMIDASDLRQAQTRFLPSVECLGLPMVER